MRIYDNRTSFYQWDIDQKVVYDFQVGDEVHFSNRKQTVALMVKAYQLGDEIVADVPNILLQSSYPINIYCVHLGDDGKYTKEKFSFTVNPRPKPAGYLYTETEILSYYTLDQRITDMEHNGGVSSKVIKEIVDESLEEAKNSGAFDGRDGIDGKDGINGKDGYTPIKNVDYFDGKDGVDGKDGKDGYTPVKGVDYFDGINGKDGTNGKDGVDGKDGINGKDGIDGKDGKDGYTPIKDVDYLDGKDGIDGKDGVDGKTPIKGEDYFTDADKAELVAQVIAKLPVYNGEAVDE